MQEKHRAESSSAPVEGMVWDPPCSGLSFHLGVWVTSEASLALLSALCRMGIKGKA